MNVVELKMFRTLLPTLLACWMMSAPVEATPLLSLQASLAGNVEQVEVLGSGFTNLYAYQFSMNFDPTVLHASTVSEGGFLASAGSTFFDGGTIDNAAGSVSFVFDTLIGPGVGAHGSGILAILDFTVSQWRTLTTLSLSDVLVLDSALNQTDVQTQALRLQIPEPSVVALITIGLLALGLQLRRRY